MLVNRNLYIKRRREMAILYSYGISKYDFSKLIFVQNSIIMSVSLAISLIIHYSSHLFVNNVITNILGIEFNILEFEIMGIITSFYVTLLIALISCIEINSRNKINLLKEELHNE